MARFRIVPEKSAVLIEASSSLHPIHTRTEGLEGFLEVDVHDGAVDGLDGASGALSLASIGCHQATGLRIASCSAASIPGAIRRSTAR